ncbi:unnamed protein product [Paramecium octaurelia]|uniref:Uncharacterized protein n=1 Tax=Paramecium octaurelia TaxID=43137 RepID=A0A8S1S3S5_PAROT|nr:unnamed protein product [Paramecium octaurelia]
MMQNKKDDLFKVLQLIEGMDDKIYIIIEKLFKDGQSNSLKFISNIENKLIFLISIGNWTLLKAILRKLQMFSKQQKIINLINRITHLMIMNNLKESIHKNIVGQEDNRIPKILVHLTALDERYIQCGSNSLHLLVQMKADLREQSSENIRTQRYLFILCNFSGSEFDNVDISGMNLNHALLFNCKWKNIKIHELNTLYGHHGSVNQICYSQDVMITRFKYGMLKQQKFSLELRKRKQQIQYASHLIMAIAFSSGEVVYLWNLITGKQFSKLIGHSSTVTSVNYSPDDPTLAPGSNDNSIRLWDVKTGQQKAKFDGHWADNSIRLWDAKTSQEIQPYNNCYKDHLSQFKLPLQNHSIQKILGLIIQYNEYVKIILEASGAQILRGVFENYQGKHKLSINFFNMLNNFNNFLKNIIPTFLCDKRTLRI